MDKLTDYMKQIDELPDTDIIRRIELIKTINPLIETEKKNLNKLLGNVESNSNSKLHTKYKKYNIEELESNFNDTTSIDDMIKIYQTIAFKIDKEVSELFTNDSSNESSDSE